MDINNNDLVKYLIDIINPFIIVFGFYVIIYGDISPGGGFQGGAILASVFILQYISKAIDEIGMEGLQVLEKTFYLLIIVVPIISLFTRNIILTNFLDPSAGYARAYLIIMNILIGMKVCLGITVIFYEFVLIERRWFK
ncbi:multicomponent Na+:H+ antiporter subunit B [Natranaerovirga pectinivora]|uniref:Multicomponent Na+:H+ antiporter subunit B n=1 Tax=Natranaerovirga pectinivora TaxID=682400 RepID=A0A4R3ML81_9FIRM|nr:MnhB domain-containing protein [Natranaerovirga pectinivora]TCT15456.1 multicomponent Na+:H+ antiporter subunit B [Natranaerovirga pectinivora]